MYGAAQVELDVDERRAPRRREEGERPAVEPATVQEGAVLALQRTLGNRAVAEMLTPGQMRRPTLQRFRTTHFGGPKQVSENAELVWVDGKTLYATARAIRAAAKTLAEVGAVVTVCESSDSTTYVIAGQDYAKVELAINPKGVAGPLYKRLQSHQPAGGGFRAFADCYRTSATTSGFNPGGREAPAELRLLTGVVPVMSTIQALEHGVEQTTAARAAASFMNHALENFLPELENEQNPPPAWAEILRQLPLYLAKSPGKEKSDHGRRIYKLIIADPRAKALFTSTFGVGGDLEPEVGTQLTQYNDPDERRTMSEAGADKWNFHWAGVILTDGADYVTLENCAVEMDEATAQELADNADAFNPDGTVKAGKFFTKQDLINDRWYFKLYGKGEQSFHETMLGDPHATPSALTVPLHKVMPPPNQ